MLILNVPTPLPTVLVNVASMPGPDGFAIGAFAVAILGTIASISVAAFTGWLAWSTKNLSDETMTLARKTGESIELAKQALENERKSMAAEQDRHMDGFMPHIAIEVEGNWKIDTASTKKYQALVISARNIGAGFAKNVEAFNSNGENNKLEKPPVPTAFGVREKPVVLISRGDCQDALLSWRLTYEDAFGRKFESVLEGPISIGSRYETRRLDT